MHGRQLLYVRVCSVYPLSRWLCSRCRRLNILSPNTLPHRIIRGSKVPRGFGCLELSSLPCRYVWGAGRRDLMRRLPSRHLVERGCRQRLKLLLFFLTFLIDIAVVVEHRAFGLNAANRLGFEGVAVTANNQILPSLTNLPVQSVVMRTAWSVAVLGERSIASNDTTRSKWRRPRRRRRQPRAWPRGVELVCLLVDSQQLLRHKAGSQVCGWRVSRCLCLELTADQSAH
jgi:hypothetical protein